MILVGIIAGILLVRLGVLFHLRQHLFFGRALFAARFTGHVALVVVMLVIGIAAELWRALGFGGHRCILFAGPAMHQAALIHNR